VSKKIEQSHSKADQAIQRHVEHAKEAAMLILPTEYF